MSSIPFPYPLAKDRKPAEYSPSTGFMLRRVIRLDDMGQTGNKLCETRLYLAIPVLIALSLPMLAAAGWVQILFFICAVMLATYAWQTDLFDGPVARFQQYALCIKYNLTFTLDPLYDLEWEQGLSWKERMELKGITHLGQTIDPAADKAAYIVSSVPLLIAPLFMENLWWMLISYSIEVILLAGRPIKDHFGLNDKAAKGPGKFKANLQWILPLVLYVLHYSYINGVTSLGDYLSHIHIGAMVIIIGLQLLSVGAHILGAWYSYQAKKEKAAADATAEASTN